MNSIPIWYEINQQFDENQSKWNWNEIKANYLQKAQKNHIFSDFLSFFQVFTERISSWRSHPVKIFLTKFRNNFRNKIFLAYAYHMVHDTWCMVQLSTFNLMVLLVHGVLVHNIVWVSSHCLKFNHHCKLSYRILTLFHTWSMFQDPITSITNFKILGG